MPNVHTYLQESNFKEPGTHGPPVDIHLRTLKTLNTIIYTYHIQADLGFAEGRG